MLFVAVRGVGVFFFALRATQGRQGLAQPLARKAASQIYKETNERRTSNTERPTSNNEFCHIIKKLSKAKPPFENMLFLDHILSMIRLL